MLDYNNDNVHTNNMPSLRQQMINEALNYHQNMNSVVFRREAKNLEVYNNPSGKTDPSQGDILVEGTIKQRINDLQSAIQRLNQTISYSNNVTTNRSIPINPRGVAHVGHGRSGGLRPFSTKCGGMKKGLDFSKMKRPSETPKQSLLSGLRVRGEDPFDLPGTPAPASQYADVPFDPFGYIPNVAESSSSSSSGPGIADVTGYPGSSASSAASGPQDYKRFREVKFQHDVAAAQAAGLQSSTVRRPPSKPYRGWEDDARSLASGDPSDLPSEVGSVSSDPSGGDPSDPSDPGDEPPAPGTLTTGTPDAKSSSKIKQLIDNSLSAIVSSYNSLIEFIDLQIRQRSFKQRDEQSTAALLKELIEPLKLLIANSSQLRESDPVNGLVEYSRIYNVLSDLVSKISSCPPFLKVDIKLLSEALPLRRDIIAAPNYDAAKEKNHDYLDTLVDRLKSAYDNQVKFHPKSQIEKDAQQLKLREIEDYMSQITMAGYKPSYHHAEDLGNMMVSKLEERVNAEPTDAESYAMRSKGIYDTFAENEETAIQPLEEELGRHNEELRDIEERLEEGNERMQQITDTLNRLEEEFNQNSAVLQDIQHDRSNMDLSRPRHEVQSLINLLNSQEQRLRHEIDDLRLQGQELVNQRDQLAQRQNMFVNAANDVDREIEGLSEAIEERRTFAQTFRQQKEDERPARKSFKSKAATRERLEHEIPKIESKRRYHIVNAPREFEKFEKRVANMDQYREKAKLPLQGPFGNGKPRGGKGPNPHKPSADPFGDNAEIEPYLTKYLRPSKERQVKSMPAIESSSDESSGEDEPKTVKKPVGGKRGKKLKEDFQIIEAQLHPDKAILIEKKTRSKRIGRGKKIEAVKPAHTTAPSQDLWFM